MSAVIFCGPSLQSEKFDDFPDFEFRPPVRQGDLYQAARQRPAAIGIIDGYFDGVPAVWHKEILWALSEGVAVFGASSMGALRAAELHSFGMVGIGRIFSDFRDGRLMDDDEVALLHGPAEAGYMALSEPMVNIRATLDRAVGENVVDRQAADQIALAAKRQFYQERSWQSVIAAARSGVPDAAIERFDAWLASGKVDQKRIDAIAMLDAVSRFVAEGADCPPATFSFQYTETWANAPWRKATVGEEADGDAIIDELRIAGNDYSRIREKALLRALARGESDRCGFKPDRAAIARETAAFRLRHGLLRHSDLAQWASENGIGEARIKRLMAESALLTALAQDLDAELHADMLDELRLENAYVALRERARAKAPYRLGAAAEVRSAVLPVVLVSWYFATRLKAEVPEDLAAYASTLGLSSLEQFYALLAAEFAQYQEEARLVHTGEEP